jgi:hypothetical protein
VTRQSTRQPRWKVWTFAFLPLLGAWLIVGPLLTSYGVPIWAQVLVVLVVQVAVEIQVAITRKMKGE